MRFRIHEQTHGVGHVLGTEWRAVGKMNPFAQMKSNRATIAGNVPGSGERRLEFLRLPVETNENTASQISNVLGSFIIYENRIESFGLTVKAEVQFAARLRANEQGKGQQRSESKAF